MNPHIPEEYGGPGLSAFEQILIGEELAWGCSGIATSIVANILGSLPVLLAGSDEQKRIWLTPLLEEPLLCSFALTEPGAGSDVSAIQTTAELRDGDYVLNGSKMFITNAGQAAWFVLFASTDRGAGHRGLSAFVVPAESEGIVVEEHLDKLGQRATDTSALAFHEVRVPASNRLGEEGEGFKIAMRTLDLTRPGTAAGAVGGARAAFEHAVEDSERRGPFGQPIAINQGGNFLLADMGAEIEGARLLTRQGAGVGGRAAMRARRLLVGVARDASSRRIRRRGTSCHRGAGLSGRAAMSARPLLVGVATDASSRRIRRRDVLLVAAGLSALRRG